MSAAEYVARLVALFAERARASAELARIDGEIARAAAAAPPITSASEARFTTRDPPAGMESRTFNARCRKLKATGDDRVWKESRVWCAKREVFVSADRERVGEPATRVDGEGYSLEAEVARRSQPYSLEAELERARRPRGRS